MSARTQISKKNLLAGARCGEGGAAAGESVRHATHTPSQQRQRLTTQDHSHTERKPASQQHTCTCKCAYKTQQTARTHAAHRVYAYTAHRRQAGMRHMAWDERTERRSWNMGRVPAGHKPGGARLGAGCLALGLGICARRVYRPQTKGPRGCARVAPTHRPTLLPRSHTGSSRSALACA